jgi:hypothetical protein
VQVVTERALAILRRRGEARPDAAAGAAAAAPHHESLREIARLIESRTAQLARAELQRGGAGLEGPAARAAAAAGASAPATGASTEAAEEERVAASSSYEHAAAPLHFFVRRVAPVVVRGAGREWEARLDDASVALKVCVMHLPMLVAASKAAPPASPPTPPPSASAPPSAETGVGDALRDFLRSGLGFAPFSEAALAEAASGLGVVEHVEFCEPAARLYEHDFWASERSKFARWLWYSRRKRPATLAAAARSPPPPAQAAAAAAAATAADEEAGGGDVDAEELAADEFAGDGPLLEEEGEDEDEGEGVGVGADADTGVDDGLQAESMLAQPLSSSPPPDAMRAASALGAPAAFGARFFSTSSRASGGAAGIAGAAEVDVEEDADSDEGDEEDEDEDDEEAAAALSLMRPASASASASLFPPRSRAASFPAGNNLRALVAMRFAEKPLLQQLLRRVRAFNVDSQLHGFVHFADSGGAATACSSQLRLFGLVVDQFSCPVVPAAEMKTLLVQRFPAGLTHDAVAVLVSHALRGEGLEAEPTSRWRHNVLSSGRVLLDFESHAEAVRAMHALQGLRLKDWGSGRAPLVVGFLPSEDKLRLAKRAATPWA